MAEHVGTAIVETPRGLLLILQKDSGRYALPNFPLQEGESPLDAATRGLIWELGVFSEEGRQSDKLFTVPGEINYDCYVVEVEGEITTEKLGANIEGIGFLEKSTKLPTDYLERHVTTINNWYLSQDGRRMKYSTEFMCWRLEFESELIRAWGLNIKDKGIHYSWAD